MLGGDANDGALAAKVPNLSDLLQISFDSHSLPRGALMGTAKKAQVLAKVTSLSPRLPLQHQKQAA